MSTKNLEQKFLRYLYDRQIKHVGHGISKRRDCTMFITHGPGSEIEKHIPGVLEDRGDGLKKYLVTEVATELESRGMVEFNTTNTEFWLTVAGYDAAAKTRWNRMLDFLNKNPGLIATVSLFVAACAFFLSIAAYFHPPAAPVERSTPSKPVIGASIKTSLL